MNTKGHTSTGKAAVDRFILGRRIASRRKSTRMGQREFAALAGLSADRLAKLEVGKVVHPRLLEVMAIAAALAVSLEELVSEGGPA